MTQGEFTNKNWTTVYKFYPLVSGNNYIVLEPKIPLTNSTGYSICLRVFIWKWDNAVVFGSLAIKLELFVFEAYKILCLLINQENIQLCLNLDNKSSEWNALCYTHNFTDCLMKVTLSGELKGTKKFLINSTFLDKVTKPMSFGLNTSFWGQITDFNIWNRPLSNEEVQQYSFGCREGPSSQPEILDWSNASVVRRGIYTQDFKINRQFLSCKDGMTHFTLFENIISLSYTKSMEFCNSLNGDLFNPTFLDMGNGHGLINSYWVPLEMTKKFGPPHLEYNTQLETNYTMTIGQTTDQCKIVKMDSKEYTPANCNDLNFSICKVSANAKSVHVCFVLCNLKYIYFLFILLVNTSSAYCNS